MGISSFRELLLKKTDNPNLKTLIGLSKEDFLLGLVIESLEKAHNNKGRSANSAITTWAGSATDTDIDMLHDALGHHISHYKAHKDSGNRDIANKHLEKIMHLADFASKAEKHSHGKLKFEAIPTQAWEMHATGTERNANGKFKNDQQGFKRRLGKSGAFTSYDYLEKHPHPEYKTRGKLKNHEGGYPFEDMKVNDSFVHVDHDISPGKEFRSHEFDNHPIFAISEGHNKPHWEVPESKKTDSHRLSFADGLKKWEDSEHVDNWLDRHDALEESNPENYANRGKLKSKSVLDNVKLGDPSVKPQTPKQPKQSSNLDKKPKFTASDLPPELQHLVGKNDK